jgi:polysaccharide export outer membrane protein
MRKAFWSALLVAAPVICLGGEALGQEPAQGAAKPIPASATDTSDPSKMAGSPSTQPSLADEKTFVIGPEDQIEIVVWGNPQIGGPVLVRPDGRVSVTLVGEVQAAGRTPSELSNDLGELLKQKDILKRPQVSVKVLQINSKKYMINGEVLKPGPFPLVVPTRVMEALVNAGGFKDFANKKDIVIIRGAQRLRFNWNDVVKGKHPEQNVFLEPGDIIIVK